MVNLGHLPMANEITQACENVKSQLETLKVLKELKAKGFRTVPVHTIITVIVQSLPLVFSWGEGWFRVQEKTFVLFNLKLGLVACQFNVNLS